MKLLIKGGRLLDPVQGTDAVGDVLVVDGHIAATGAGLKAEGGKVLDADGLVVTPGLVDIHSHLREPGQEHKEDIASGTRAAARGGYTTVCAMPNTVPPIDTAAAVSFVLGRARETGAVRVLPIGAVSKGQKGEELAELGDMALAGAVAFSDDGHPVTNGELMRNALTYARPFKRPIISHCEDKQLAADGVMHLGYWSSVVGLRGQPAAAEEAMASRDVLLAGCTGGRLHLAHVSTNGALAAVRRAKAAGLRVTAEATPHHLLLTDEAVAKYQYDTDTKVNPPLRDQAHVDALRAALADGSIDAIATDHAPHHLDDKEVEYNYAAFGISGLETAFALIYTQLVEGGVIDLVTAVRLLTLGPARCLDLKAGTLEVGAPADIALFDLAGEYTISSHAFASKGRNTPFEGWLVKGRAVHTLVGGKAVVKDGRVVA